ncbi:MAG: ATP-binding protein [Culicoidibacterales bacterium]
MKISKKVSLYSSLLVFCTALLIILYFTMLLPGLYTNNVKQSQLSAMIDHQKALAQTPKNDSAPLQNSLAFISAAFNKTSPTLSLNSNFFSTDVLIIDEGLKTFYSDLLVHANTIKTLKSQAEVETYIQKIDFSTYAPSLNSLQQLSTLIQFDNTVVATAENFTVSPPQTTIIAPNSILISTEVRDQKMIYSTHFGFLETNDKLTLTYYSTITSKLNELSPIILQSLPTIISVSIILILASGLFFSKVLVDPLHKLITTANQMKHGSYPLQKTLTTKKDEIAQLNFALDTLYNDLALTLVVLQDKNRELEFKNNQSRVFLLASSHQLKTPIASSLLLIEGMIAKIGKYHQTEIYLPEIKTKLLAMRSIVDEVLELQVDLSTPPQQINTKQLLTTIIAAHQTQCNQKSLLLRLNLTCHLFNTQPQYFYKILDNLIKNAISYSPDNQVIEISNTPTQIIITNFGITIPDDLINKIFEPFVRVTSNISGHGLGLYIVAYYAHQLGLNVTIINDHQQNAVIATINIERM